MSRLPLLAVGPGHTGGETLGIVLRPGLLGGQCLRWVDEGSAGDPMTVGGNKRHPDK